MRRIIKRIGLHKSNSVKEKLYITAASHQIIGSQYHEVIFVTGIHNGRVFHCMYSYTGLEVKGFAEAEEVKYGDPPAVLEKHYIDAIKKCIRGHKVVHALIKVRYPYPGYGLQTAAHNRKLEKRSAYMFTESEAIQRGNLICEGCYRLEDQEHYQDICCCPDKRYIDITTARGLSLYRRSVRDKVTRFFSP